MRARADFKAPSKPGVTDWIGFDSSRVCGRVMEWSDTPGAPFDPSFETRTHVLGSLCDYDLSLRTLLLVSCLAVLCCTVLCAVGRSCLRSRSYLSNFRESASASLSGISGWIANTVAVGVGVATQAAGGGQDTHKSVSEARLSPQTATHFTEAPFAHLPRSCLVCPPCVQILHSSRRALEVLRGVQFPGGGVPLLDPGAH